MAKKKPPLVAYWRCCQKIWAGPQHPCPKCLGKPTMIADKSGKPTDAGKLVLQDVVQATTMREDIAAAIDRGRPRKSPTGPPMKNRKCKKCGKRRIGDIPGRPRGIGAMLWATAPQDFVPVGTEVCICLRQPKVGNGPGPLVGKDHNVIQRSGRRPGPVAPLYFGEADSPERWQPPWRWRNERMLDQFHWQVRWELPGYRWGVRV